MVLLYAEPGIIIGMSTYKTAWDSLAHTYSLSPETIKQLQWYADALVDWNQRMNLTAITDIPTIISHHLDDSLALAQFVDMSTIQGIADVGSGAGFPMIPLKIAFPHLRGILIEVLSKRIQFLEHVIDSLKLSQMTVCPDDWRTFLRSTEYDVDLVVARASLKPEELVRMFKPSSPYRNATLVYWASAHWEPSDALKSFVVRDESYTIGDKQRRLIFCKAG